MNPVDWADRPPLIPSAHVWLPPDGYSTVALLGKHTGCWVHWTGKRTFPCGGEHCPTSMHRRPSYWVGYFPACVPIYDQDDHGKVIGHRPVVLAVSAENIAGIDDLANGQRVGLDLYKEPGKKAWTIQKAKPIPPGVELPKFFSVLPVLFRLWGMRPPDSPSDYGKDYREEQRQRREAFWRRVEGTGPPDQEG